jgi:type I restriction enzyme S subunit
MVAPKLRFRDENGEVFGEWGKTLLGKACSVFKSGTSITSERISNVDKYPVFGGNGLRGYTNTYTHDGLFVLIGRQGALCGNINLSNGKSYISEHAIAVQANPKNCTMFLAHNLRRMQLNRLSESSAQPGLSVAKLIKLVIYLPTLPEQTKIANFLLAVDERIQQVSQTHALLTQYKKGSCIQCGE